MKNITYAILCLLGLAGMQSCSLHDDTEDFDTPAANRIENTVENAKNILESAPNGWELHYVTGENNSGGGYTFLLKFADGKVEVAGDAAVATPAERAKSSYDINRSMGPVLTFNTYNSILHKLGSPNMGQIEGEQGDWEFVITDLTDNTISLRGKKWGNSMVMTRLPESTDWTARLDSIATVSKAICTNYLINGSDKKEDAIDMDADSRRVSYISDGKVTDIPFFITTTGIQAIKPIAMDKVTFSELELKDGSLKIKDNDQVSIDPYIAPIEAWEGTWALNAMAGSCDITLTKYEGDDESENVLEGTFTLNGEEYAVYFDYDPETGNLHLDNQVINDPTGKYYGLWLMNADLEKGALVGEGGMNLVWYGVTQEPKFVDDGVAAKYGYNTDTFIALAVNSQGQPVREDNSYVFVIEWYFLSNLSRGN